MINKLIDYIKKNVFALGLGFIGGLFGAYGGAKDTSKAWRRVSIPIIITIYTFFVLKSWLCALLLALFFVLSIGYGIPSRKDEGSLIGKFWYYFWSLYPKHQHLLVNIFTRGTIGIIWSLCLIIIPIINGKWNHYFLKSLGIIIVYSGISWRNLGTIKLLGKDLSWVEIITYGLITYLTLSII